MERLVRLPREPVPLNWVTAHSILRGGEEYDELTLMRVWTEFFRSSYREAAALAREVPERRD